MTGDFIRDALVQRAAADRADLEARFPVAPSRAASAGPTPDPTPDPTDIGALRRKVAGERGVPVEAVDRVRGETRAELEADSDQLLTTVASVEPYRFVEDFDAGARGRSIRPERSMDDEIRTAFGREPSGSERLRAALDRQRGSGG